MKLYELVFVGIIWLSLIYLERLRKSTNQPRDFLLIFLVIMVFFSTFIPSSGGILLTSVAGLDLRDILFVGLFAATIESRRRMRQRFIFTTLGKLLIAFYITAAISVVVSRFHDTGIHRALNELRPLVYISFAILIPNILLTKRQLFLFLRVLLLYTILMISLELLKEVGHVTLIHRREPYWELTYSSIFVFLYLSATSVGSKTWRGFLLLMVLLELTLVFLAGGRHYYLGLLASLPVFFLALSLKRKFSPVVGRTIPFVLLGLMAILTLYEVSPSYKARIENVAVRFGSIFQSKTYENPLETGDRRTAVGRRMMEKTFAMQWIKKWPIFGTGLGFKYWDWTYRKSLRDGQYLDNGWLWLWMKMGTVGLISFLLMSLAYVFKGILRYRWLGNPILEAVVLGFACQYWALCFDALARAGFFNPNGGATFGILIGTGEAIFNVSERLKRSRRFASKNTLRTVGA